MCVVCVFFFKNLPYKKRVILVAVLIVDVRNMKSKRRCDRCQGGLNSQKRQSVHIIAQATK